ncbi:protein unc-13 homolog [Lycium ferocissimum]|uniref:protein unc-13 homolog n=1 Tax=Lycium ferocissimum TaxID=112874 RepID=UPI0028151D99|nr:protein unc-13 homolog [Lycium ferocissimum]
MDMVSYGYRDARAQTVSRTKMANLHEKPRIPILPSEDELPYPFGELGVDLTESELRETAYEILVGACRSSSSGKPLKYVSSSVRSSSSSSSMMSLSPSFQRSTAASKVKKALGLKSRKKNLDNSVSGELMRVQMGISEQTDSRVRRAFLRLNAGQLGRRLESMVLPVELLQQFKSTDFPNAQEYEVWQTRNLKLLEAGLVLHPCLPLDETDTCAKQLQQIIHGALVKPMETGKHSESMQVLRNLATSLACRSFDGSSPEICHWADGTPLNLRLYQILLEACFDVNDKTSVIEEVDEVLDIIKKTWVILGIDQMFHNICFSWVLFHRYVATSQVENDLLFAADNLLSEVAKDAKAVNCSQTLSSLLGLILDWAEKRLLMYHDSFYRDNVDIMQSLLSMGLSAMQISGNYQKRSKEVDVAFSRVDSYIRASMLRAFSQEKERLISSRKSSKQQQNPLPILCILAQNVSDMAYNEKEIYSGVLKRWHPLATGVAVAVLHGCYGNELKKFVLGISELTPDAVQVLIAADKLEKGLVQMAVADAVDSEDGGKSLMTEMTPYEAEAVIANLVKSWIRTRVDRLKEWVNRNLQQEVWNPHANKERFAPSGVEVLRSIDETFEAFFLLPIPMHPALLPELMNGLDACLQSYILKAISGCGSRSTFVPTMPALTRCSTGSKFSVFRKKERPPMVLDRKSQNGDDSFSMPQLCVRINTLHSIRKELDVLEKRTISQLRDNMRVDDDNIVGGLGKGFELSVASCREGIQQLSEAISYKVIFHELSHVFWDYLYAADVSSSRIEPFLQELEKNLEIISATVHDRVRTRVITNVMKASFDGFLFILLAGGPSRAFSLADAAIIDEDLKFLMDLFWSDGDGLPTDLIDKFSTTLKGILPLFHTETAVLIEQLERATEDYFGPSAKSRFPLPPTSGNWSPTEPSTILRVLCYRNDKVATKFLRKNYNLPKKL